MVGVLNQRTLNVPVSGLTLSVQTERETLGETGEMVSMWFVCCVSSIQDRPSLVGKHCEMCIQNEVDDLIRCRHVEAVAEPVHCHLGIAHGVKHEVLQVLLGLRVGEKCFCHVDIIGTGCPPLGSLLCHLSNWLSEAADQFVLLTCPHHNHYIVPQVQRNYVLPSLANVDSIPLLLRSVR